MHSRSEPKQFKPGFLSSLNRSFRIKSSHPEIKRPSDVGVSPYQFGDQTATNNDPFNTSFPIANSIRGQRDEDVGIGNFRRCHSINVNRKQGLVKIPEMPLKGDLLKRVWNDGLDNMGSGKDLEGDGSKPLYSEISTPRIDSYRFSMANLEDTQEGDLDAILTQLCALESKCDEEIRRNSYSMNLVNTEKPSIIGPNCHQNAAHPQPLIPATPQRTDSPDNDSAFSDTVSMLSSESSTSSGASAPNKTHSLQLNMHNTKDAAFQAKAEKIRLALEKMKKASIKKLFIKAFSIDGSSKSLLVDEKMTCGYVARLLADKNHVAMEPKWAIVEYLPDLQMERIFEDHEILVDNLMIWARESKNKIFFAERPEKVAVFQTPERYLISENEKGLKFAPTDCQNELDEHSRSVLIEEFFNSNSIAGQITTIPTKPDMLSFTNHPVPPMEGPLYLKSDSKKGWKKYHFVLRSCGLYYYPKEKTKTKEMVPLTSFEVNEIYIGINWKKKHKAPTDYCFALKHPRLQQPKCVKYVKFLCAEDKKSFDKWLVALRIAKHGRQLLDNYRTLADDLAQEDLDLLANARSCSVMSISHNNIGASRHLSLDSPGIGLQNKTIYSDGSITGSSDISSGRHSCISSSSSSGCMSDGGPSGSEVNAFDSEFSTGTIKRKPCMKPNIPLTSMTRQLKEMVDSASCSSYSSINTCSDHSMNGSANTSSGYTNTGTLTRRSSRRKSIQSNNTDESSGSGTLKRHKIKNNRGSSESMTSCNSSNSSCNTPSKSISIRDTFAVHNNCNGNQSPTCQKKSQSRNVNDGHFYDQENRDALPTSGIILGYITQQTIVPNREMEPIGKNLPIVESEKLIRSDQPQTIIYYPPVNQIHHRQNSIQDELNSIDQQDPIVLPDTNYDDEIDNIQNMPLPPPPNFTNEDLNFSFDPMFSSTLSLESLPPPPPDMSLSCYNFSESQLSLLSLPPPPSLSEFSISSNENFDPGKNATHESTAEYASPQSISERIEFYNSTNRSSISSQDTKENDGNSLKNYTPTQVNVPEPMNKPKINYNPTNSSGIVAMQSVLQNIPIYSNSTNTFGGNSNPVVDIYSVGNCHFAPHAVKPEIHQIVYSQNVNSLSQESCTNNSSIKVNETSYPANIEHNKIQNQISSPILLRKHTPQIKSDDGVRKDTSEVKSPIIRRKQVSFNDSPSPTMNSQKKYNTVYSSPRDEIQSTSKPPPPKRNESTKLSSPNKLADSSSNPPMDFLKDLQRVMRKKWQVAQKCKLEPTTTPHEVLGFREYPILIEDYKETNVSNWVQEHYGHSGLVDQPNLYENVTAKPGDKVSEYGTSRCSLNSSASTGPKKRPPPPIPKRSENTHLSASYSQ
ncbi:ras-associated and pleckstrin homology domains-containing protein pico [Arctopsyche grandis]|uniref:ras-associated and pleckstrin homology domains-containing protein pico n=1 Tax=Arctopsyche grandis TaxID=121162 RepID=UPI00406D7A45